MPVGQLSINLDGEKSGAPASLEVTVTEVVLKRLAAAASIFARVPLLVFAVAAMFAARTSIAGFLDRMSF